MHVLVRLRKYFGPENWKAVLESCLEMRPDINERKSQEITTRANLGKILYL